MRTHLPRTNWGAISCQAEVALTQDFASILSQHVDLDELFLCHQEALIALDPQLAARLLQFYRELLGVHMAYEDDVLLPLYQTLGPTERAPVVLYAGQHHKLMVLLGGAESLLRELIRNPAEQRRQVLRILDHESTLKHLLEHHHAAESQALFPVLDAGVQGQPRESLIAGGWRVWNEKRQQLADAIDSALADLAQR